jgi:hypothetical protein
MSPACIECSACSLPDTERAESYRCERTGLIFLIPPAEVVACEPHFRPRPVRNPRPAIVDGRFVEESP